MIENSPREFTRMLQAIRPDDSAGTNRIFEIIYEELHRLAGDFMRGERIGHTLQPTALVNEAYCKLVDQTQLHWKNRAHFFRIAARAMRQILVDHARRRSAGRRGGDWQRVTFEEGIQGDTISDVDIIDLDNALTRLAEKDERLAQIVEMRVYGGLSAAEVAEVLGVSRQTIQVDWKVARLWLARELSGDGTD